MTNKVFGQHSADSPGFAGSQQAEVRARATEALSSGDTIITLTGPVGSGKSTLVQAAIKAVPADSIVARLARIKLRHDEVLELLLAELGIERQPAGTIQRFTKLKRLFEEWREQGKRVFIVVEDAQRMGADAISELESLTSADNGGASGASIVLMGLPELGELLDSNELTRTRQRTSLTLTLEPFNASEVQEYLAHCFTAAGGKLDELFESGAADMIYRCTGGSPRVINKLGEAVLTAAAKSECRTISPHLVQQIATSDFGLKPAAKINLANTLTPSTEPLASVAEKDGPPHLIQDTLPGVAALSASEAAIPPTAEPSQQILEPQAPEALIRSEVDTASVKQLDDALRPDTHLLATLDEPLPVEENLTPVPLDLQNQESEPAPEPPQNAAPPADAPASIPTLSDAMRIESIPHAATTENSEDTQTLKRPNIKALESALATARMGPLELDGEALATEAVAPADPPPAIPVTEAPPAAEAAGLPEITLDHSLEERKHEAEALLEEKRHAGEKVSKSTVEDDDADTVPAAEDSSDPVDVATAEEDEAADRAKLDKLAADLGNATSLEDIDDVAAETLFGEEFSQIAAAVAAMAAADSANDADMNDAPDNEEGSGEISLELSVEEPLQGAGITGQEAAVSFESVLPADEPLAPDINASASRRFAMLKAMNQPDAAPNQPPISKAPPKVSATVSNEVASLQEEKEPQVAPIENQFGTSMTHTLEALKFERPSGVDDDEGEKSGGFLSRFKRS